MALFAHFVCHYHPYISLTSKKSFYYLCVPFFYEFSVHPQYVFCCIDCCLMVLMFFFSMYKMASKRAFSVI